MSTVKKQGSFYIRPKSSDFTLSQNNLTMGLLQFLLAVHLQWRMTLDPLKRSKKREISKALNLLGSGLYLVYCQTQTQHLYWQVYLKDFIIFTQPILPLNFCVSHTTYVFVATFIVTYQCKEGFRSKISRVSTVLVAMKVRNDTVQKH